MTSLAAQVAQWVARAAVVPIEPCDAALLHDLMTLLAQHGLAGTMDAVHAVLTRASASLEVLDALDIGSPEELEALLVRYLCPAFAASLFTDAEIDCLLDAALALASSATDMPLARVLCGAVPRARMRIAASLDSAEMAERGFAVLQAAGPSPHLAAALPLATCATHSLLARLTDSAQPLCAALSFWTDLLCALPMPLGQPPSAAVWTGPLAARLATDAHAALCSCAAAHAGSLVPSLLGAAAACTRASGPVSTAVRALLAQLCISLGAGVVAEHAAALASAADGAMADGAADAAAALQLVLPMALAGFAKDPSQAASARAPLLWLARTAACGSPPARAASAAALAACCMTPSADVFAALLCASEASADVHVRGVCLEACSALVESGARVDAPARWLVVTEQALADEAHAPLAAAAAGLAAVLLGSELCDDDDNDAAAPGGEAAALAQRVWLRLASSQATCEHNLWLAAAAAVPHLRDETAMMAAAAAACAQVRRATSDEVAAPAADGAGAACTLLAACAATEAACARAAQNAADARAAAAVCERAALALLDVAELACARAELPGGEVWIALRVQAAGAVRLCLAGAAACAQCADTSAEAGATCVAVLQQLSALALPRAAGLASGAIIWPVAQQLLLTHALAYESGAMQASPRARARAAADAAAVLAAAPGSHEGQAAARLASLLAKRLAAAADEDEEGSNAFVLRGDEPGERTAQVLDFTA